MARTGFGGNPKPRNQITEENAAWRQKGKQDLPKTAGKIFNVEASVFGVADCGENEGVTEAIIGKEARAGTGLVGKLQPRLQTPKESAAWHKKGNPSQPNTDGKILNIADGVYGDAGYGESEGITETVTGKENRAGIVFGRKVQLCPKNSKESAARYPRNNPELPKTDGAAFNAEDGDLAANDFGEEEDFQEDETGMEFSEPIMGEPTFLAEPGKFGNIHKGTGAV
ncbi:hypothetical protein FH972_012757 [Carpinus fangiana]|uniref:Uncharacterized protein n=1 Tax=Carpinus fangiana TaxID=176857 RepID=A0A5N6R4N8_9ROSI|nr:hypothetical protein FH972_012757 [Carpinus fangiana]